MWGYFGDFVSLLRNIPSYRDLPLAMLLPEVFPDHGRTVHRRRGTALASTASLLDRLGLTMPSGFSSQARLKRQSDQLNDDWSRRFSELRLGTQFDLVPTALEPA